MSVEMRDTRRAAANARRDRSDLRMMLNDVMLELDEITADALTIAVDGAKADLRAQTLAAGLGQRNANAWRGRVYKNTDGTRAGFVWSRAPNTIHSMATGAVIRPLAGRKYLCIPTKSVPRARGHSRATSTSRMTPEEVERHFNQKLIIRPGRGTSLLAFIVKDRALLKSGNRRKARKGRLAHGDGELVLMFTLVRSTRRARAINIDAVAEKWVDRAVAMIANGKVGRVLA